jgi:OOP family OmpA-OmpF porin
MVGRIAEILGALAVIAMAAPAQAAGENWSFEIAMGQASFTDVKTSELDLLPSAFYGIDVQDSTLRSTDRSYALITSYRFSRNLAMETGFFRLGAFQYTATGTADVGNSNAPASFNFNFRAKGVMLGIAAALPLGEILELRGRGGISTSSTRVRRIATVQGTSLQDEITASSQDFYLGAGVGANFGETYRIGIDWILHRDIGKQAFTYSATASNVMLSVAYMY